MPAEAFSDTPIAEKSVWGTGDRKNWQGGWVAKYNEIW